MNYNPKTDITMLGCMYQECQRNTAKPLGQAARPS